MIQWYAIRATGAVTLILFTATVVLGLMNSSRFMTERWPRFVIDGLHRSISLLAVVFLSIHIVTGVTDSFVQIDVLDAVIPFHHSYSPFWVGLGAVALDLLLALIVTSLLKARLGLKLWRGIHWLAYLAWPVAVAHGIGNGTDSSQVWMLAIDVICIGAVLAALTVRLGPRLKLATPAW